MLGDVLGGQLEVQLQGVAVGGPHQVVADLVAPLGVGLDDGDDVMRPEPVVTAVGVAQGVDEAPDADEPLLVHVQPETLREVAQDAGEGAAQLFQLLLVHEELALLPADGAAVAAIVTVLTAFP